MTDAEREIKRLISYIRSCRVANIDCTVTIDKSLTHGVLNALEEIQQYRAIGTVEECREAMNKLPVAEETIRKLLCSDYDSSCQFCIQNNDEDAICCNIGGSESWCSKNAKWVGRLE